MPNTLIDDPELHRNPPHLIDEAMASRPRAAPTVLAVDLEGGTVLWSEDAPPYVLTHATRALWPFLDGETPLGDLAEDLAEVTDAPIGLVRYYLTSVAAELDYAGLATGLDSLMAAWRDHHHPEPSEPDEGSARGQFEEVRDGVLHVVTEIDVNRRQLGAIVGRAASVAELVPPDSCTGKRLQLDRQAEVVSLDLDGSRLAVRCADEELLVWLRSSPATVEDPENRGPIVAFVTSDDGGGRRRFSVYDQDSLMVGSTRDRAEVQRLVLGALVNEVEVARPPGTAEARMHVLVGDGGAALAVSGSLARPRGLHRQLGRAGVEVVPTRRVFLSADGESVSVPLLASLDTGAVTWVAHPVIGSWIRGNRPGEVGPAQEIAVLLSETRSRSLDDRRLLLEALERVVRTKPVALGYRADISTRNTAGDILALFGG